MSDGLDRQLTDRELAWVGIGLGVLVTFGGILMLLGRGVSFEAVAFTAAGVLCFVFGWGRRKDRHNPDELPRYTYAQLGRWTRDGWRWLRRKR